jgi:molybdenum cofactor guanylyltransferase
VVDAGAAVTQQATLAILAGGEGRRMGRAKGDLRIDGRPILSYLLDRFRWGGPTVLVTAPGRERPPGSERFDREVSDPAPRQGPLRGVLTALQATESAMLVVASCDMPLIESRHLTWLVRSLAQRPTASLVMPTCDGRVQPFPLSLRRVATQPLVDHFASGSRSMRSLLEIDGAAALPTPEDWPAETWTNLNAPVDVAKFQSGGSGS